MFRNVMLCKSCLFDLEQAGQGLIEHRACAFYVGFPPCMRHCKPSLIPNSDLSLPLSHGPNIMSQPSFRGSSKLAFSGEVLTETSSQVSQCILVH